MNLLRLAMGITQVALSVNIMFCVSQMYGKDEAIASGILIIIFIQSFKSLNK